MGSDEERFKTQLSIQTSSDHLMIHEIDFMNDRVHPADLPPGVLYLGEPGSGKTATMLSHVRDMCEMGVPLFGVDAKADLPPFLASFMPPSIPVYVIDPFHIGGFRIAWSSMLKTETAVDAFIKRMIPEIKGDSQPHFRNSAVLTVKTAARHLNHYALGKWQLADLIRLAKNRKLLLHLNKQTPELEPIPQDREDHTSTKDVQSTVETSLSLFEIYSSLELRCTKEANPYDLIDLGVGVMVMLWSDEFKSVLSSIATFLIDSVTNRLLSRQADDDQLTILWLDELASLQKLEALDSIARRGRTSKCIPLVGCQTYEGIRAIYGPDIAEQTLGLMPYKIFFRQATVTSARFAADLIGIPRVLESISTGNQHAPWQFSVKDGHHVVTPEEMRRIPKPNLRKKDSIKGFLDFPNRVAPFDISVLKKIQHERPKTRKEPVPASYQTLPRFTPDDMLRLNFPNCLKHI